MSTTLINLVNELEALLRRLEARRNEDPLANDCFEAAWYWRDLGRWVLDGNTRVNYPERAKGEFMLLTQLREFVAKRPTQEQDEFTHVLDSGEELLKIVATFHPPKDGHLGFLRIVREHFAFVEQDLNFKTVQEEPTQIRFSSGAVYLELSHAVNPWMSCTFGPDVPNPPSFWIHDLLYMTGDDRYKTLPEQLDLNTEETTAEWFSFLATCFREYGRPILANDQTALTQIAVAQAKRDGEYAREMELKYGSKT